MQSLNKIVGNFVAKLNKFRMLFKDILKFLGLDYRDALNGRMDFLVAII